MFQRSVISAAHTRLSEDNLAMDKGSDLLRWILGGLMLATVAVAIVVGSTNRIAPTNSQTLGPTTTQALTAIAPILTPAPALTPTVPVAQIQTVSALIVPGDQIWECTINGQKTFSDNPCGDNSSLHEIGPINRMDPTPILRQARSYEPESSYQPEYVYPSEQENYNPRQEYTVNSYPVFVAMPFHERRKPEHAHRPPGHYRGPPIPRN
jgi:hypothetical protein